MHLPRTWYQNHPYDNEMAQIFWGQMTINKAAALFFYQAHSQTSKIIYTIKYGGHPDTAVYMGSLLAKEFSAQHFFDDIDIIIPVPLAARRRRQRGYNQSERIAQGISTITHIPVITNCIKRTKFIESQTTKNRQQRRDNVKGLFHTLHPERLTNKHILIVDDVLTTGATILSCTDDMRQIEGIKISVVTLGFAKS